MKKVYEIIFLLFAICSCQVKQTSTTSSSNVYYHYKTLQPYISITFDDGPNKIQTPKILNILDKYQIKATFFVIGENAYYQKELIKKIYDQGHEIGNHFYNHININKASKEEIKENIIKTNDLIESIIGERPKILRPPYGIVNDTLKEICSELSMSIIIWTDDKDSRDWAKTKDSEIISKLTKKVTYGDIFLFHDGSKTYTNTLSAIDVIIPLLQKKGFEWVSVSKLINN